MTRGTDREPWAGETPMMPTRYRGRRAVAGIKLPTGSGPHAWVAVFEMPGQMFATAIITRLSDDQMDIRLNKPVFSYGQAIEDMVTTYGYRSTGR